MCLFVNTRFPHRYTTIQPMTVYKLVDIYNMSFIRHFQYTKRTGYALDRELMIEPGESVAAVFEGFHAYVSIPDDIGSYSRSKIVKFVIPAGSHLFVGAHSDVVSDRIESGSLRDLIFGSVMHTSIERWLKAATGMRLSTLSTVSNQNTTCHDVLLLRH